MGGKGCGKRPRTVLGSERREGPSLRGGDWWRGCHHQSVGVDFAKGYWSILQPHSAEGEAMMAVSVSVSARFFIKNPAETIDYLPRSSEVQLPAALRIMSEMETHQLHLTEMELQIHHVETEAYSAVLRAFITQSDVLSWGKEALISELRKELRVSDVEHREILAKVKADNSIKTLRKLHKGAGPQEEQINIPHKRLKSAHTTLSSSPRHLPHVQPSLGAVASAMEHFRDDQLDNSRAIVASQANMRQGGNILMSGPHTFEIRSTEELIHEVERICGGKNPDPHKVERARLILKEHERALVEAISKLADVPDDDDPPNPRQPQTSYDELKRNEHGINNVVYEQPGGLGPYYKRH
ncbi:hypothetical protein Taro_049083 [Colocasia esculenta]|uniref:ENT domain-containing protein n=1 Tax=Colocasia esculenta TaxID=4460 RepID=A0A843XA27_COLES|nr:hypothetical protein [Colocasia esculenta]